MSGMNEVLLCYVIAAHNVYAKANKTGIVRIVS